MVSPWKFWFEMSVVIGDPQLRRYESVGENMLWVIVVSLMTVTKKIKRTGGLMENWLIFIKRL